MTDHCEYTVTFGPIVYLKKIRGDGTSVTIDGDRLRKIQKQTPPAAAPSAPSETSGQVLARLRTRNR